MVAARLANLKEGRPSTTAHMCAVSQSSAAELLNVSRRTSPEARTRGEEIAPPGHSRPAAPQARQFLFRLESVAAVLSEAPASHLDRRASFQRWKPA